MTTLVTAPTSEPVTLTEMKSQMNVVISDDDTYISDLISAARDHIETVAEVSLFTETFRVTLDGFWGGKPLLLERPPLQSITSIVYDDADDVEQTLASSYYVVDTDSEPGTVYLAEDQSWPTTRGKPRAVRVTYVAGWSTTALIPPRTKHLVKMLVAHWYENREPVVIGGSPKELPFSIRSLIAGIRVPWAA